MAKVVSASDASDRLSALLDEVRLRDAAFVIERDGLPAAALVPVGLLDRFMTGGRNSLGTSHDAKSSSLSGNQAGNHAGHVGGAPADHVDSTSERPIDRIDALRSMLAQPRGGERFEAVLERTFSNVRKQRRKQLARNRNV